MESRPPIYTLLVLAVVLVTALAFGIATGPNRSAHPPAAPAPAAPVATARAGNGVSYLYVVQGRAASTTPAASGYDLTVTTARDGMTRFTDRPARDTAHMKISDFVAQWKANGFLGDPPNAALTGTSGTKEIDVAVELTTPRWNPVANALSFHARPLVAGAALPPAFDDISLFIDNSSQNTIQVNLTNLTSIPLSIQSVAPDSSTWSTFDGNQAPAIGYDFGLTSANGTNLNIGYANASGGPFTTSIILMGDYNNEWQLTLSWNAAGVPSATLNQFSGTNIAAMGLPAQPGVPVQLTNLSAATGNTAIYQVIFNDAMP